MKQIVANYTFSTGSKTVTLTDFSSGPLVDLKRLYLITDVTTNQILYNFADASVATASISSFNVINLSALPGGVSSSDSLQIVYETLSSDPIYVASALPTNAAQETGGNLAAAKTDLDTLAGTVATGKVQVNNSQVNGTAVDTNSGVKSAGTQRVVLATDQPQLTNALKVDGSAVTQPVSATSLPLPTGAATAAKQPAIGTAGTASADVISVQGVAGMTPVKVDNSGVTQPVNGTVTANIGTGNLAGITSTVTVNNAQVSGTAIDTNSGTKSAGTQRVVLATDQPQLTNAIKVDGSAVTQPVNGTVTANIGTGNLAGITGTVNTSSAQSGTWTVQPGNTANSTPWLVSGRPATSGGLSTYTFGLSNTANSVKASAGQLYGWYIYNSNVSVAYVQFFNVASGSVSVGTTTPLMTLGIPAGSAANVELSMGIAFSTAISIAASTTRAGGVGPTNNVDVNLYYN